MLLGKKPLAELTEEEMHEAITELRASREALRAEAIQRKKARDAGEIVPREKKSRVVKEKPQNASADMLAFLRGEKETI